MSTSIVFKRSKLDEGNRNPLECQKLCAENDQCQSFMYRPEDGMCFLSDIDNEGFEDDNKTPNGRYHVREYSPAVGHWYSGPKSCSGDEAKFCDYFVPSK